MHAPLPTVEDLHSIEAEQSLVGACLLNNVVYGLCESIIDPDSFYEPIHGEIWQTIGQLVSAGKIANPVTLQGFLPADMPVMPNMSLKQYLARLAAEATTIINARDYAWSVRNFSDRRKMQDLGRELLETRIPDPDHVGSRAFDILDAILSARRPQDSPSLTIRASVVRSVEAAAKAYQNNGALTGMSYGLRDMDAKTGGLHKGELTLLAGRPGMMKTGLALNMVRSLCSAGYHGIFFSLEMGDVLLTQRLMSDMIFGQSQTIELPYSKIRRGQITEREFDYIRDAADALSLLPLQIEQQGGIGLSEIGTRARRRQRKEGLDFVVVDYIGLMGVADRYRGNRVSEIAELSAGLVKLAKDLDVAALVLCQLSRGVESREDKRPRLSDLRESGSLEQDASVVIMLYREAYYLQTKEPRSGTTDHAVWQADMLRCWNKIDIQIEKNRNGPVGTIAAYVNPGCNAVRDLSVDQSLPMEDML